MTSEQAEIAELRARRDFLLESNNRLVEERRAAEAHVERLRLDMQKISDWSSKSLDLVTCAQNHWDLHTYQLAIRCIAATPAQSLARVKAEALREAAKKIWGPSDGPSGLACAYLELMAEADRLEAK